MRKKTNAAFKRQALVRRTKAAINCDRAEVREYETWKELQKAKHHHGPTLIVRAFEHWRNAVEFLHRVRASHSL